MSASKKYFAEGLGAFAKVLFGCGSAAIAGGLFAALVRKVFIEG